MEEEKKEKRTEHRALEAIGSGWELRKSVDDLSEHEELLLLKIEEREGLEGMAGGPLRKIEGVARGVVDDLRDILRVPAEERGEGQSRNVNRKRR